MESFLSRIQYMNYASAGLFVAFSINFRLCVTLRRPVMPYVGVVSLYVHRSRSVQLLELPL